MARCQPNNLVAEVIEERIVSDQKSRGSLLDNGRKCRFYVMFRAGVDNVDLQLDGPGRFQQFPHLHGGIRIVGIHERADRGGFGNKLMHEVQGLGHQRRKNHADTGDIAAGTAEALDEARPDRIAAANENNRNIPGRHLGRLRRCVATTGNKHGDVTLYQFGSKSWQSIIFALGPEVFDEQVLSLRISGFTETLAIAVHLCGSARR